MPKIRNIFAREILDSRGNPTVEALIFLDNGLGVKAAVPSGASTGKYEALELRDNDQNRYAGKGVLTACRNIEEIIAPVLIDHELNPEKIDQIMIDLDGTKNKSKLGANAILAVSLAVARAAARLVGLPLYKYLRVFYQLPDVDYRMPVPMFNVINGGVHSDSGLDVQEFMIVPAIEASFSQRLKIGVEVFNALREILKAKKLTFAVGDEGGFAPKLKKTENVFDLLTRISDFTKHQLGNEVFFGVDVAASIFHNHEKGKYLFEKKNRTGEEMAEIYWKWFKSYPMISIEDPFAEDDWDLWVALTEKINNLESKLIIGDDLFTTNIKRFQTGIEKKAANAILIKLNQIGTLSETMKCISLARDNNYQIVISHRSGETNDDFISDLAVAVRAEFIKSGAPNRGERVAKYNRLAEIEEEL